MISLVSQMNELPPKKNFAKKSLKKIFTFNLCVEDLPCDGGLRLFEFIESKKLALVVARKLSNEPEVTIGKIFQEFVDLLESLI